jgi:hypothetical protein
MICLSPLPLLALQLEVGKGIWGFLHNEVLLIYRTGVNSPRAYGNEERRKVSKSLFFEAPTNIPPQ